MVMRWGIHTLYQSPRSFSGFADPPKTHSAAPFMPSHESILCYRKYACIMMPLTWFGMYHYFPEQIEMHLTLSIWLKNSHSHFKPVFCWRFLLIHCLSYVYSLFLDWRWLAWIAYSKTWVSRYIVYSKYRDECGWTSKTLNNLCVMYLSSNLVSLKEVK